MRTIWIENDKKDCFFLSVVDVDSLIEMVKVNLFLFSLLIIMIHPKSVFFFFRNDEAIMFWIFLAQSEKDSTLFIFIWPSTWKCEKYKTKIENGLFGVHHGHDW